MLIEPKGSLSKSQVINRQMQFLNEGVTKRNNTTLMNLKSLKGLIHLLQALMFTHLSQVLVKNSPVKRTKLLFQMSTHRLMMFKMKKRIQNLIPKIKIKKI